MAADGCIVVTGASGGLGLRVAERLCGLGREVVLACRSKERGEAALLNIRSRQPAALATVMILDLADADSVRAFAADFRASGRRLGALVNNAGLTPYFGDKTKHALPSNGWEATMATNHLGHFLLTNLLLSAARESGAPLSGLRVVIVTSMIVENPNGSPVDVTDIVCERPGSYKDGRLAYKHSKEANAMFALELARRTAADGALVNCLCPGFMPETELFRESGTVLSWIMKNVLNSFVGRKLLPISSLEEGAQRVLDLTVGTKGSNVSGAYFKYGEVTKLPPHLTDADRLKKLWEASERLVGLPAGTL